VFFKHFRDGGFRLIDIVYLDALPVCEGVMPVDEVEEESCGHDVTTWVFFGAPHMQS
jgi:hypothetical protein